MKAESPKIAPVGAERTEEPRDTEAASITYNRRIVQFSRKVGVGGVFSRIKGIRKEGAV